MSITNSVELRQAIVALELKRKVQEQAVIDQFHITKESLKPGNIVRNAVSHVMPPDALQAVLKTAGTVGMGLITSKLFGGVAAGSKGKAALGGFLTPLATKTIVNNIDTIKAYGLAIYQNLFKKSK